jgi:hypothetical protein
MRAAGSGHRFCIFKKGDRWIANYDGHTEAEGATRMEAVQNLNRLLGTVPSHA